MSDSKLERMERRIAELELRMSNLETLRSPVTAPAPLSEAARTGQSGKIEIKASLEDNIRRLKIDATANRFFDDIRFLMKQTFRNELDEYLKGDYDMVIKYTDSEGDLATMANDADWECARKMSPILRLTICRKKWSTTEVPGHVYI